MISTILVVLFLLQIISFYFIVLLNAKISKFKDIENKQEQVFAEIEDSFSAYIAEIKDENNRLLHELHQTEAAFAVTTNEGKKETIVDEEPTTQLPKTFVSKQRAANSYLKTVAESEKTIPVTMREKVLHHHDLGKSIEEIAKLLQIGKTEVELFLKFID